MMEEDKVAETTAQIEEDGTGKQSTHHSRHNKVMASSVLKFDDVNFVVGSGDKERNLLTDVCGKIKWGHVLAIMGPSGAGKTTLITTLTLDAHYGVASGKVTLNGVPLTDSIFKEHCFVVVQHDKHWPYLTCRETLQYCAELYQVADDAESTKEIINEVVEKMGLSSCVDISNARLSGGQRRRLSIAIALLKQPTVLFLDEPTSGLDAASATNIMQEIVRVAKEEQLIVVCTIHQPSTKVYNCFDELMIMSRGRLAFAGDVNDALPYFESIGHPCPEATNPAEFYLDLVNSDFSDEAAVKLILDTWEEKRPEGGGNASSHHQKGFGGDDADAEGVTYNRKAAFSKEIGIIFRRHFSLIIRDPILYIGRAAIFLVANLIFAIVYWNARDYVQEQAINKMWLIIWFIGVPTNMGVVAVYALNDEFKSILRETKNGMIRGLSYVLAKSLLVIPIFIILSVLALGIPLYAVQGAELSSFGMVIIIYACTIFAFESVAELLSVSFDDPILGMLQFMNYWFGAFLFGGFLIPPRDIFWPLKLFYYIMPFTYYIHSVMYHLFKDATFDPCVDPLTSAVCIDSSKGLDVLQGLGGVFPIIDKDDTTFEDIGAILAIGVVFKVMYIVTVIMKIGKVANIKQT